MRRPVTSRGSQPRNGITLIELLVVLGILVVLAAITYSAIGNLNDRARVERTKTIIARIDGVLRERWDSYRSRPLSLNLASMPPEVGTKNIACIRARAIRDLQRMELPECASDIDDTLGPVGPVNLAANLTYVDANHVTQSVPAVSLRPALTLSRAQRILTALTPAQRSSWPNENAQAECLYIILSGTRDGDTTALDFLAASEVGDTDGDGMPEVLDAWGQPLYFWRWASGYVRDTMNGVYLTTLHDRNSPDPFDPQKADPQWNDANPLSRPFALRPLVVSAGPDKVLDLVTDKTWCYAAPLDAAGGANPFYPVNPYPSFIDPPTGVDYYEAGPKDFAGNGLQHFDNVSNHYIETP